MSAAVYEYIALTSVREHGDIYELARKQTSKHLPRINAFVIQMCNQPASI